jgi:tight adherence protein C
MIMLILAIGAVFAAVYFLMTGLTVQQKEIAVSMKKARRYGTRDQREIETRRSMNERVVGPLTEKLANMTMKVMPKTDPALIHNRLMAAGVGQSMTSQMYMAVKGGLIACSLGFGLLLAVTGAVPFLVGLLMAIGGAAIGFIAPDFYLNSRIRGRKTIMQAELPNVLDLLSVSVEAGLGFDAALVKLNERMEGPLVDEFALVLHEMRVGESRLSALKHLGERCEVHEVSQFCRAIIQADQLGIALSRILKVQSKDMRIRRQLAAEEKAMKAPVKMLFPTVIFIFPAMFVVALGPAALSLMQTFTGGM